MESIEIYNRIYPNFPFDAIKITGNDSTDFLHRISTNDFKNFLPEEIQKTLLINEKGRIIDAVWIKNCTNYLLMFASQGIGDELIRWLNKYIIMEEICVENAAREYSVSLLFDEKGRTDFFGFPVTFLINQSPNENNETISEIEFEKFRIQNGIPKTKKELTPDYNPLELNLWNFISFTKGCYIGQEVIARLDTYNKIQRSFCYFTASDILTEKLIITDDNNVEIGKITSAYFTNSETIGLALIKQEELKNKKVFSIKDSNSKITIEKIFAKSGYGRN